MSASAQEYYGYLLSHGYGEEQIAQFAYFADLADKGIISQNKAYNNALEAGWNGADGDGQKKTFADWMNQASEQGWIDKGLEVFGAMQQGGMFGKKDDAPTVQYVAPAPTKKSKMPYILGGLTLLAVGTAAYFIFKNKK